MSPSVPPPLVQCVSCRLAVLWACLCSHIVLYHNDGSQIARGNAYVLQTCEHHHVRLLAQMCATNHMPPLHEGNGWAANIEAVDPTGGRHTLGFRSWANGKSRMYLLEGLREVQAKYGVGAGDVVTFRCVRSRQPCTC